MCDTTKNEDIKIIELIKCVINSNTAFYRHDQTIRWSLVSSKDIGIFGACDRKTNIIQFNKDEIEFFLGKNDLLTIEYFVLHEIRHIFQNLEIEDYKNGNLIVINKNIIEKWICESENYESAIDKNGHENGKYFMQDSELDAYGFSYAVMKYKYENIKKLFVPNCYKSDENFWTIVNDWIKTFENERIVAQKV